LQYKHFNERNLVGVSGNGNEGADENSAYQSDKDDEIVLLEEKSERNRIFEIDIITCSQDNG
jgi:hypothetical protein